MTETAAEAEWAIMRIVGLMAHRKGYAAAYNILERAKACLERIEREEGREGIRARTRRIAAREGYTFAQMVGHDRSRPLAYARFEVWWECHEIDGFSYPSIGHVFNRHHTSIMHGARKWAALLKAARAA